VISSETLSVDPSDYGISPESASCAFQYARRCIDVNERPNGNPGTSNRALLRYARKDASGLSKEETKVNRPGSR
jgi:hypothetical protein